MTDLFTIQKEQIGADLSKVVDRIVRQYESFGMAFQKEFIQNAWDAREDRKKANGWQASISLYRDFPKTHIVLEDRGTIGMNEKRWDAFLSLWKPEKSHNDAGGQGQGKFVLMGASEEHILLVESRSRELGYRLRILQNHEKNKLDTSLSIMEYIPSATPLEHIGTRVWVYDATESALKMIKSKEFTDSIRESWWQVLSERYEGKIKLSNDDITIPSISEPAQQKLVYQDHRLGDMGYIKRYVLNYHDEKIPGSFRGIRVQRSNMTVLTIPFEVNDKDFEGKFSGYIEFDHELEIALKSIEKTDHCGFVFESPWKEIKKIIRDEAQEFVNEILPSRIQKRKLNFDTSKLIKKANQIISDYCPEVVGSEGPLVPDIPKKPVLPLRIKYLNIGKRELKYNDTVTPSSKIVNETNQYKKVTLAVDLKHNASRLSTWEYRIKIKAGKEKLVNLADIRLIQTNFPKGKYTLRITLREDRHDIDSKSTSFFLEETREVSKKGFIKNLDFYESPEPLRNQPITAGVIALNLGHEDFVNIYNSFEKKPQLQNHQIGFYIIRICVDEAVSELLKTRLKNIGNLDADDLVRDIVLARDRMYSDVYTQ